MRFRGKSIRRKIVVLLLVPLVSLVSIWGFATYITASEADRLLRLDEISRNLADPTEDAVQALQLERRQVLVNLADPRTTDGLEKLHKFQRATDRRLTVVRDNAADSGLRSGLGSDARARLSDLLDALDGLEALRGKVEETAITRGGAFQAYNELVDPAYAFIGALSAVDNVGLEKQGRALVGVAQAREYLSREDSLMAAAYAAGQFTQGDQRALSDRVAERNIAYQTNLPSLPEEDRRLFENFWNGSQGRTLRSYEDTVIAAGPRSTSGPVAAGRWETAVTGALDELDRRAAEARQRHKERIEPFASRVLVKAAAAGVLGFLAVLASLVISFRVGRGLVRDLTVLRKEANESAGVRLPSVMRRLAAGDRVDVDTEAPHREYSQDEMGQVGQALNTLQRAAVEAAVKQADMRRGVSEVFVNLARRNQVLLHRQLTLLDAMERRTEDADELADLFRLDHMTTRMRRHAEGLVILSGAAPSRQWRKPVQLMDVVRAAVAEVEDYERIEVRRLPRLAVDGSAVADLTHLIAELLENATVFSPPHTAVQVLGERVTNGFTLEIHDRGLGMPSEALLDANLRLAETPEFELSDTDRLGLFVVSRLAQRQGVRVSLQTSPYGGTTAVVLIPGAILTETPGRDEAIGAARRTALAAGRSDDGTAERDPAPGRGTPERALDAPARTALSGPVELEAPVPPQDGSERRRRSEGRGPARNTAGEQHQQAGEETGPSARPLPDGRAPLPRRRRPASEPAAGQGPVADEDRPAQNRNESADTPGADGPGEAGPRGTAGERTPARAPEPAGSGSHRADGERRATGLRSVGDTAEPGERTRTGQPGQPGRPGPAADPAAAPDTGRPAAPPATVGGLPRRVRQASLAPQLRTDAGAAAQDGTARRGGPAAQQGTEERDADEVRSRMAALQRGWERGRRENGERTEKRPGGGHDAAGDDEQGTRTAGRDGTGRTADGGGAARRPPGERRTGEPAHGTTPEGNGR
ncbi:nitrate- and nitrite sensing domain-containing protein [Streptomyces cacaoi]|uniref:histidine kinase n=2 Tax=Streptomyces cacaoi TaxID=1898 RepID=A0A4Y3QXH9_STRCI|nr:nitrate- and nitrite sensing domain-containing protein [Streptomyces cacaoi]GEB49922.1 histidine kinase [Streptomyces cacaoi]